VHTTPQTLKWWMAVVLFALCVGPTFISYESYVFTWDDADYLQKSIAVDRAFWATDLKGMAQLRAIGGAMYSMRPPMLTLLGLPWGNSLKSWDAAGKCFVTLGALTSLMVACCLYLLLRVGMKPQWLVLASLCVFASLGPYPAGATAHVSSTAFLADSLFGWTCLAALLLIPYEARTDNQSIRSAILGGALWGTIFSFGVMTKINFLYFAVLIAPILLAVRFRHSGLRPAAGAFAALGVVSLPAAAYLIRHGGPILDNAKASSYGGVADFYYVPLSRYVADSVRESPGLVLSLILVALALLFVVIKSRASLIDPDFLPVFITAGFGIAVVSAPNRQIRYALPAIIALPFLTGALVSGKGRLFSRGYALLGAGLVFCGLVLASVPMRHRPDRQQSLGISEAVLRRAAQCDAKHILLITDSPTLNQDLMNLALIVSDSEAPPQVDTLAYNAMLGKSIEEDFRAIRGSDQVVFQDKQMLSPSFTNLRVDEYERYTLQLGGHEPSRVEGNVTIYPMQCRDNRQNP